jgi:DNA-binding transcriptional MocR family regulator
VLACLRAASRSGASGAALRVHASLLLFIDGDGECYPSQRKLAELTGLDRRSVRRALSELEDMGLLQRKARWGEDGARRSDCYALTLGRTDAPSMAQSVGADVRPGVGAEGGRADAPLKVITKNKTISIKPEGADVGRSAPVMHSSGAAAPAEPNNSDAYAAAVKANKRQDWLRSMSRVAGAILRGRELDAAKAGIQGKRRHHRPWPPACAGVTRRRR